MQREAGDIIYSSCSPAWRGTLCITSPACLTPFGNSRLLHSDTLQAGVQVVIAGGTFAPVCMGTGPECVGQAFCGICIQQG
jgi:hypothetical protein